MASLKKLSIIGIFISFLTIFAMSHNASAADFTITYDNYSFIRSNPVPYINCQTNTGNITNVQTCSINNNTSGITKLNAVYLNNIQWNNIEVGDIFELYLNIHTSQNAWIQGGTFGIVSAYSTSASTTELLSVEEVSSTVLPLIDSSYSSNPDFFNLIDGFGISQFNRVSKVYRVLIRVISVPSSTPYTINIGLQARTQSSLFEYYSFTDNPAVDVSISNFKQYRFQGSEENKEVEEKTQEAVDESQSAGSDSSSSASQGGANLLSAITGFFNVITSASPTNCVFNAPLNTYFGNERLNVDLCSLDLPSGIGALTSIIAIGILIPFAIHMFNKFIALFRSFQS